MRSWRATFLTFSTSCFQTQATKCGCSIQTKPAHTRRRSSLIIRCNTDAVARRLLLDMQAGACLSLRQVITCTWNMAERLDTDILFKALADLSRRKLLDLLHAHDGRTLNDLC